MTDLSKTMSATPAYSQDMNLGYIIFYVADVTATLEFYERAFGLTRRFLHESGDYGELETGSTALAFAENELARSNLSLNYRHNRHDQDPAGVDIGLVTTDVEVAYRHALKEGATSEAEPKIKPWGQTVAYVRDNNGLLVQICSPIG
jgi:lactoylglutathione lyase